MSDILGRNKGISPLIASVLLMAFTLSIAMLAGPFFTDTLKSTQDGTSEQTKKIATAANLRLKIHSASYNHSAGELSVTVQNKGDEHDSNISVAAFGDNAYQKDFGQELETNGIGVFSLDVGTDPRIEKVEVSLTNYSTTASREYESHYYTCQDVLDETPGASSRVYTVDPDGIGGAEPFPVYCEMSENGGGWMLLRPYEKNPRNRNTPNMFAMEHACNNGIEDGSGSVGAVTGGYGDPFTHYDSVGSDSEFNTEEPLDWNDPCGDSDNAGNLTQEIGYKAANSTLSSDQLSAVRNRVSDLSNTTQQAITTTDVDEYEPEHDIWAISADGSIKKLTPEASANDADYRWTDDNVWLECDSGCNSIHGTDSLENKFLLPAKVKGYNRNRGGGVAWWYRKPYALVK